MLYPQTRAEEVFVITFDNVAYNYNGGELLSEVTLRLTRGSFRFLTGPSGAGKTTPQKLAYEEFLQTTATIAEIIGALLLPSLKKAGDFLIGIGFQGASWLSPLLLSPAASIVAFFTTCAAAFRKLREVQ